jgi:hypothetical protein
LSKAPAWRATWPQLRRTISAARIIYWFLKEENDPAQRGAVLRDAIGMTDGVNIPVGFISLIEPNPKDENAKEEFVPAAVLQELKACVLRRSNPL